MTYWQWFKYQIFDGLIIIGIVVAVIIVSCIYCWITRNRDL